MTTTSRTAKLAAAGAAVLALGGVGLAALPAGAQSTPADEPAIVPDGCVPAARIDAARQRIDVAIQHRFDRLDLLDGGVAHADALTDAHRSTLQDRLASTRSGLTDVKTAVDAETDGCKLADEARSVVSDYRVFVVLTPQVRLTVESDRIAGAQARVDSVTGRIDAAIATAQGNGTDVTQAQADEATFESEAAAAIAEGAPVGDTVLGLTPADWPDPARASLGDARTSIRDAATHVRAAIAAAQKVRTDLAG